jgi:23S rRNA (adenine2503-C2)-methyltransferase
VERPPLSGPPVLSGHVPEEIAPLLDLSPPYRGMQIFKALWSGAASFHDITTLAKPLREQLAKKADLYGTALREIQGRGGEAEKLLIRCADGYGVECVLLTDGNGRKTVCLSTQAGCGMGCAFCKTGTLGFTRDLTVGEMTEQVLYALRHTERISNIVFMGMGEPLLNLENLRKAAAVLTHPEGFGIGVPKITLSTCGITAGVLDLTARGPYFRLAVSLVSALPEKRARLMPAAAANPLPGLRNALLEYQKAAGKRITFEYVLLPGVNDGKEDISALRTFVRDFSYIVNVIPYNPVEGLPFTPPVEREVKSFLTACENAGIACTRRYSKGRGIGGACGQLGGCAPEAG